MSENKSSKKSPSVAMGDKNKIIFSYRNGKLQGTLLIVDKKSLTVNKSKDAVFINIDIPVSHIPRALLFLTSVLVRSMRKKQKKAEAVDIDEVLGSIGQKTGESEDVIGLME